MQRLARGRPVRRPVTAATQQILCRFVQDQVDRSVALAHHQRRRVVTAGDVGRTLRLVSGVAPAPCPRCESGRSAPVAATAEPLRTPPLRVPAGGDGAGASGGARRRLVRRVPSDPDGDGDFGDDATVASPPPVRGQGRRHRRVVDDEDDLLDDPSAAPEPAGSADSDAANAADYGADDGDNAADDGDNAAAADGSAADDDESAEETPPVPPRKRARAAAADRGLRGRDPAAGLTHALRLVEARHLTALARADAALPGPVVDAYAECVRLWSRGVVRVQPLAAGRRLAAWTPGDDAVAEDALRRFLLPPGGPVFLPVLDRERCALYVTVPSAEPPRVYVARIRGGVATGGGGGGGRDAVRACVEHLLRDEPAAPVVTGLPCPRTTDAAAAGLLLLLVMETAALQVPADAWEGATPPDLHRYIPPELLTTAVLTGRRTALRRLLTQLRRGSAGAIAPVPVMTSDPALGQPPEDEAEEEEEEEGQAGADADADAEEEAEAAAAPPAAASVSVGADPAGGGDAAEMADDDDDGPDGGDGGADPVVGTGGGGADAAEAPLYAASDVDVELDAASVEGNDDDGPSNPFRTLGRPADASLDTLLQPHEPIADAVVDAYDRFLLLTKPKLAASVYVTQTATTRRIVADALDAEDRANTQNLADDPAVRLLVLPMTTPDGARLCVINRFPPVVLGMAFGDERDGLPDAVVAYSRRFTGDRQPGTARLRTTPCAPAQAGLYMLLIVEHFVCFATRPADWALSAADIRLPDVFPRGEQKALSARLRAWLHEHLTRLVDGDVPAGPGAKGCYLRAATAAALDHGPHEPEFPLVWTESLVNGKFWVVRDTLMETLPRAALRPVRHKRRSDRGGHPPDDDGRAGRVRRAGVQNGPEGRGRFFRGLHRAPPRPLLQLGGARTGAEGTRADGGEREPAVRDGRGRGRPRGLRPRQREALRGDRARHGGRPLGPRGRRRPCGDGRGGSDAARGGVLQARRGDHRAPPHGAQHHPQTDDVPDQRAAPREPPRARAGAPAGPSPEGRNEPTAAAVDGEGGPGARRGDASAGPTEPPVHVAGGVILLSPTRGRCAALRSSNVPPARTIEKQKKKQPTMKPVEMTMGAVLTASGAAMLATGIVLILQSPERVGTKIADTCPADTAAARKCRAIYETADEDYLVEALDLAAGLAAPANGTSATLKASDPGVWSMSYRNRKGAAIALIVCGAVSLLSGFVLLYLGLRGE
jgi:hypothetical protein